MFELDKSATSLQPKNFIILLIEKFIELYVKNPDFFEENFLQLSRFKSFKQTLKEALDSIEKKPQAFSYKNKTLLMRLLKDLSNFEPRLGLYLQNSILRELEKYSSDYLQ